MEGLQLCPLCLCEGPRLRCAVYEPRQHQGFIELELGAQPHPPVLCADYMLVSVSGDCTSHDVKNHESMISCDKFFSRHAGPRGTGYVHGAVWSTIIIIDFI